MCQRGTRYELHVKSDLCRGVRVQHYRRRGSPVDLRPSSMDSLVSKFRTKRCSDEVYGTLPSGAYTQLVRQLGQALGNGENSKFIIQRFEAE